MSDRQDMSGSHDCGGDAAAYLLGALAPVEAKGFERHLERCIVCRDELEALTDVVQALPMAAPQHRAPKRLHRRVMQAIQEAPAPAVHPLRHSRLALRWSRPGAMLAGLAAAAMVAAAVIGGVELAGSGGARVIQARVVGVSGSAELRLAGGRGELIVRHMSPPQPGHVYEVWLKAPRGAPSPTTVLFSVTTGGAADVGLPGSLRGVSQVMVTPEPDGGSLTPTHTPVIVAPLT